MNYIIRVENESEWRDVLAHYKKEYYTPYEINNWKIEIAISNNGWDGYNRANKWFENNSPYNNYKFLSYTEWKEIVSPKPERLWKVGDIFIVKKYHEHPYKIESMSGDKVLVSWKHDGGSKYDMLIKTVDQHFKEGSYTIVNKPNNMNTKEYFSAQGSKFIKKALIEQLESEGFKPAGVCTKDSIVEDGYRIGVRREYIDNKYYSAVPTNSENSKEYTLPQDYDAVLQAFREFYKEEGFKVGDWAITTKPAKSYEYRPEIGFVFQIKAVANGGQNLDYTETESAVRNGTIGAERCRKATDAEIAEAQKPKEKVVRVSASNGAFDVTVSKGKIMAEGKPVLASELRKLVADSDLSDWVVSARTFDIGCKRGVTRESIREIVQEYDKLNG